MGGEPHVLVGEREIIAHLQQDHPGHRVELAGKARLLLETLRLTHRHVHGQVDLPGLDGGDPRRRVLDDLDGDAFDLGLRAPVAIVAFEDHPGIELVVDQPIRPAADRLLDELLDADGFEILLRDDIAAQERHPLRRRGRRLGEPHRRPGGRLDLDLLHLLPGIGSVELRPWPGALEEGVAEILGGQLVAVVEDGVVMQLDLHAQGVRRKLPVLEQVRHQMQLRILADRLVVDHLEDRLGVRREALVGIPSRDVVRPGDGDGIGVGGNRPLRPHPRAGGAERQHLQECPASHRKCHRSPRTRNRPSDGADYRAHRKPAQRLLLSVPVARVVRLRHHNVDRFCPSAWKGIDEPNDMTAVSGVPKQQFLRKAWCFCLTPERMSPYPLLASSLAHQPPEDTLADR